MSGPTTPVDYVPEAESMDVEAPATVEQSTGHPETGAKKQKSKAIDVITREPGRSLLPHARVQRILKADKELTMVQREAAFLIARATEEFVHRLSEAAQSAAARERRTTVQAKDLTASVRRAEEFAFLEELLPWLETAKQSEGRKEAQFGRKGKKPAEKNGEGSKVKTLDHFVGKSRAGKATAGDSDDGEDDEDLLAGNLIEHPDGTLSLGGPADAPP